MRGSIRLLSIPSADIFEDKKEGGEEEALFKVGMAYIN
jgi:hypothetical protein